MAESIVTRGNMNLIESTRIARMLKAGKLNKFLANDSAAIKFLDQRHRIGRELPNIALDMDRIGKEFGSGPVTPEALARFKQYKRLHMTGRHLPRHPEMLIPAGATAEETAIKVPRHPKYLFRGKELTAEGPHFTSIHPEVGASYATNRDADEGYRYLIRKREGELIAYHKKTAHILRTQSAGDPSGPQAAYNTGSGHKFWMHRLRRSGNLNGKTSGFFAPRYETLIHNKPTEAGRYHVKLVRDKDMNPLWQVSSKSGIPARRVFAKYQQRESIVTRGILREAKLSGIQQFAGAADDILPLWNKLHKPAIAGGGIYIGGKYVGRRKNNQYVPPSDDEDDSYFKMSAAPSRVGRTELMESRRIA